MAAVDDTLIPQRPAPAQPRWMTITGWILTVLVVLMLAFGFVFSLLKPEQMNAGLKQQEWPLDVAPYLLALEVICALLYIIPKTSILGAIVLTGYFGGAIATHLRQHDPILIVPLIVAIIVWLGIYLREPRLRQIVFGR